LRGCFVDRDYYAVEVAAGQTLTVTASSGYAGNRRMRILNPQGSQVAYYNGTDEPSMVQATITTTGTCRFMMRVWSNDVVYDLSVELTD
ncbi:MAG: PPC domain-containing protein, partial [Candidatus Eiseniibacteriota bacterium]